MRYADASRVSSFLRQLVVASVILPSDVVFLFHSFFRPRSLPCFLAGIPRVEDDADETGGAGGVWGWYSGLFFSSLFDLSFFICRNINMTCQL